MPWQIDPSCVRFPDRRNAGIQLNCDLASQLANQSVSCSFHSPGPWFWMYPFSQRNVVVTVSPKAGSSSIRDAAQEQCASQQRTRAATVTMPCGAPNADCSLLRSRQFLIDTALRVLILRDPWDRTLSAHGDALHQWDTQYNVSLVHVPGCTSINCSVFEWATKLNALCHSRVSNYWVSCRNEHLAKQAAMVGEPDKTRYHYVALLSNTTEMDTIWSEMLNTSMVHVKGQGQKRSHTPRLSSEEPGMDCSNAVEFCKKPPNARQPDNARCCRALQIIQDLYADDYALARRYGIRMPSDRDHGFFGDFT